jgi:TonB family protein
LHAIDKQKEAEALILLKRAHDSTDIRAESGSPFRLDAEFKLFGMAGGTTEGKYALVWASPDQWREEISFPGFSQVRVGGKGKVWMYRNIDFRPLRVSQLYSALDVAKSSTLKKDEKIKAYRHEKMEGKPADCVKIGYRDVFRKLCFDPVRGVLTHESQRNLTFNFESYARFGSKIFPQIIRVSQDGDPVVEVTVTKHTSTGRTEATLFTPPKGSVEWGACSDPDPPEPKITPEPDYPKNASKERVGGTEVAYILVDANGDVQHAAILESIGPEFDESVIKTLQRKWKFMPGACNGTPVPIEEEVEIRFFMLH